MVGNFCKGFIFAFFASQEPFAKIKTVKISLSTCEVNEPRFNPRPTYTIDYRPTEKGLETPQIYPGIDITIRN